ncbi:MAG: chemotaxis protein CheW [Magnetococcus sp. MYC-9]
MTHNEWNPFDDEEEARSWVGRQGATSTAAGQTWLFFLLDGQLCGLPARQVVQMVRYAPATPIPGLPPHLAGLCNLQGEVIPVMDLRLRLTLPAADEAARTVLVVVQPMRTAAEGGMDRQFGLRVDGVEELMALADDDIEPVGTDQAPFATTAGPPPILGVVHHRGKRVPLLDLDNLLSSEEMLALIAGHPLTGSTHV